MLEDSLQELLKNITIRAIGEAAQHNEDLTVTMHAIDDAEAERAIFGHVQFGSGWQATIDNSDIFYIHTELKLAPYICKLAYENTDERLNDLVWHFILPNIKTLSDNLKPKTSIDWLPLAQVAVETESDNEFNCLKLVLSM
ncbi:MAG: hypothetical protein ACI8PW_000573 [Methylophilaceae bacterium]|jgi:hypothetical protein